MWSRARPRNNKLNKHNESPRRRTTFALSTRVKTTTTSPSKSRRRYRRRPKWPVIVLAMSVVYLLGVIWGMQLAYREQNSFNRFDDSRNEALQDTLELWTTMWESYMEPIFETVYDGDYYYGMSLFKNAFADDDDDGGGDNTNQNNRKWEPEVPRFAAPETLNLPKPIINVGFPKAGTSTIFSFFHCNGLKGQHWFCCEPQHHPGGTENSQLMSRCVLENLIARNTGNFSSISGNPPPQMFDGCGDYDFYSEINGPRMFKSHHLRLLKDDGSLESMTKTKQFPRMILPQHHYLEEIHEQFPNATFILNMRPTHDWVESVMQWGTTLRLELVHEFFAQDWERGFNTFSAKNNQNYNENTTTMMKVPQKPSELRSVLEYIMDYHSQYVRDFVAKHPSHALIEVDITQNSTGRLLADAFGLNETCWGHYNQNKNKNKHSKNKRNREVLPINKYAKKNKNLKRRGIDQDGGDQSFGGDLDDDFLDRSERKERLREQLAQKAASMAVRFDPTRNSLALTNEDSASSYYPPYAMHSQQSSSDSWFWKGLNYWIKPDNDENKNSVNANTNDGARMAYSKESPYPKDANDEHDTEDSSIDFAELRMQRTTQHIPHGQERLPLRTRHVMEQQNSDIAEAEEDLVVEQYQVGDTSREARQARKELYQRRMKGQPKP